VTRVGVERIVRAVERRRNGVSLRRAPRFDQPISQACTYEQLVSDSYVAWCTRMNLPPLTHRKLWEWCYILQVLDVAGMIRPGKRALGFAVGTEPITALVVAGGAHVVATDLPQPDAEQHGWIETGEHAASVAALGYRELCPEERWDTHVTFRPVDMRDVPDDLGGFDCLWSSCAIEHLGSLDAGLQFVRRSLDCLAPGGVAVHTTEFNVASNDATLAAGHTVLYRRRDLEGLIRGLRAEGHRVRATFALGTAPEDLHVDEKPYTSTHIRTATDGVPHTSFGIVVHKRG
jgi:hypothetical protein